MKFETHTIMGSEVRIPITEGYGDCVKLIKSDSYRHNGRNDSMFKIWIGSFTRTSMGFSIWYRLSQHKGWAYPFIKFMLNRYKLKCGLFIPAKTRIGYGMYIQHCFGIVINSTAIVGNNSHFSQFTSIGANTPQAAKVGDNVYFGPGSIVIDNVEIGTGACIGGGAVVVKNVNGNAVVGGVPAKELNTSPHPEYIRHPYKEEWLNIKRKD